MTTLQWAQRYVKWGWSVIPVRDKKPYLETWVPYRQRFPTNEELIKWFGNSDYGIAVVTGKLSGISVIDVDGMMDLKLQSRVSVTTPHGKHYYFKYDESLKNWVKPSGQTWDIRTEGGYCCCPPTSGYFFDRYWVSPPKFGIIPANFIPKETIKKTPLKGTGRIEELLNGLMEGNRDTTFTSLIGLMSRDGYTESDIFNILKPHSDRVDFGDDNLSNKIRHIKNDYPQPNRTGIDVSESDSLTDFLADIHPVSWICEPIFGMGTLGFIAGLPKTLKTWITMDLAISVASGTKWLGRFPVTKGKVLFVDQERYKGEVQRRIKLLMNGKGIISEDLEQCLVVKSQTTTRIDLEESFNAFRRKLDEIRPTLVIVDSFATFHTKAENDRRDIQIVLERLKQLRTEFGCTILMIDHEGKSVLNKEDQPEVPNAFSMVGSVGKSAAAETVLTVRKLSETESMLYHTASNLGPTIESVKVRIQDVPHGVLLV